MAASLNRVLLIGNLTRDPELRYLPSGQAVTTFTVAVNRVYKDSAGERKKEASFVRIVTWARRAEVCNEYLKKGSPVFVEGRLQSRSWEANDGTKRNTIEVVAQNVQFLGRAPQTPQTAAVPSQEEAIVDDSFGAPEKNKGVDVKEEELAPDNEVPF